MTTVIKFTCGHNKFHFEILNTKLKTSHELLLVEILNTKHFKLIKSRIKKLYLGQVVGRAPLVTCMDFSLKSISTQVTDHHVLFPTTMEACNLDIHD